MHKFSSQDRPLISILIPLYNHEAYIEECLDSILLQENLSLELLLIDDGSSDRGFDIACNWRDLHQSKFVKIEFLQQINVGITKTFDKLIRKSSGKFSLILASDDVLLPNSILNRLELFDNVETMAVFGDAIPIDAKSIAFGQSAISELGHGSNRAALLNAKTQLWELIFRWNIYGSVLMLRRDALINPDGSSILNLDIFSEDMQFYYKFSAQSSLKYVDKPVAKYRVHAQSASKSKENIQKLHKNIYQSRLNAAREMSGFPRVIVLLQAFTYHRWDIGLKRLFTFPMVVISYVLLKLAFQIYKIYSRKLN